MPNGTTTKLLYTLSSCAKINRLDILLDHHGPGSMPPAEVFRRTREKTKELHSETPNDAKPVYLKESGIEIELARVHMLEG